jgi:hypothetical protein
MITREQEDSIFNALTVGMSLSDAYIYAGLSPEQIAFIQDDTEHQRKYAQMNKAREYSLLHRMDEISIKQSKMGKETATAWLLEKTYPRYSNKPQNDLPDIHINIPQSAFDPSTVSIHQS